MKGCARTCLLWILGLFIAGGAYYIYLRTFGELHPHIFFASGAAAFFTVLTISYAIGVRTAQKERTMLLGAMLGEPPRDGEWVAVSGPIRALSPLRAPITGQSVVAYQYEVYRMVRSGGSRGGSTKTTYWEGKALASSTIAGRHGAIRLLAVPSLDDVPEESTGDSASRSRLVQYIQSTTFQTFQTLKAVKGGISDEWTDDDGQFRRDKRTHEKEDIDPADCLFTERNIKQGETVCAFGLYSSTRGGLVPHENWSKQARLMRGDATGVAHQLRRRMIKYAIGVVICTALAFGVVKLYEKHAGSVGSRQVAVSRG